MKSRFTSRLILIATALSFLSSCYKIPKNIEPIIAVPVHPKEVQKERGVTFSFPQDFSCSPFLPLTPDEGCTDWGKEYRIALAFADDFDLYRAITGFKRALFLLPPESTREMEIQYCIALAYYLGRKYVEVVSLVGSTVLSLADATFPAFDDLLLILYESYEALGNAPICSHILNLIQQNGPEKARKLALLSVVKSADFEALHTLSAEPGYGYLDKILCGYQKEAKSVKRAQAYNALLPGAGYWYVGLKETAVTAFLVNALFIAAATQFFLNGNEAAGAITLSLEGGWYFGGITGAGCAAKQYNEKLYCNFASKITQREECFPLLMLRYTF